MQPTGKLTLKSHELNVLITRLEKTAQAPGFKHFPSLRDDLNAATVHLWRYLSLMLLEQAWSEPDGAERTSTERQGIAAFNNSRRAR